MTFEEHLRATAGSSHTVRAYLSDALSFQSWLDGKPLSIGSLEDYVLVLNHGRRRPQTVHRYLSGIRRWLAFQSVHGRPEAGEVLRLMKDGYKISPTVRGVDRKEVHVPTEKEFRTVWAALPAVEQALAGFLWWTGARIGEVLGDPTLGTSPLASENGRELIDQGWTQTQGKGGRRRILILPMQGRHELSKFLAGGATHSLFPTSGRRFRYLLERAIQSVKVKHFSPHGFRHAFRSRLRQAGIPDELMRRLMGHHIGNVTEGYGKAGIEELLEAVKKL